MKPTIIPIPLGPGGMVNAFLLCGERTILIDTGFPGSGDKILAALRRHGIAGKNVSLILLTHAHIDHIGSVFEIKHATGAPVAVHDSELQSVRSGRAPTLVPISFMGHILKGPLERRTAQPVEPDIAIIGGMSLAEFGVDARVIETPGHTAGSISVIVPDGPAIAGDLLSGALLRRERPAHPHFHEDIAMARKSLQRLLKSKPTNIFLGHGGPVGLSAARSFVENDRAFARSSA